MKLNHVFVVLFSILMLGSCDEGIPPRPAESKSEQLIGTWISVSVSNKLIVDGKVIEQETEQHDQENKKETMVFEAKGKGTYQHYENMDWIVDPFAYVIKNNDIEITYGAGGEEDTGVSIEVGISYKWVIKGDVLSLIFESEEDGQKLIIETIYRKQK